MSQTATKTRPDFSPPSAYQSPVGNGLESPVAKPKLLSPARLYESLSLLWRGRRFVGRASLAAFALGTFVAFLIPKQYQSNAQLMPPDSQSNSGAMLAALSSKAGNGLGAMAGDLLGNNSTGALFLGVLRSRTLEDRLVQRFDLKKVYGVRLEEDARTQLSNDTGISQDHKSGIISLSVIDHTPDRAAALAQAYGEELGRLVADLSTSAAHRERVFLEDRLKVVKRELDQAEMEFSQFASQNSAINIPEQGKAMVEAAAALQGQMIAAESELKGLEEIYTASNVRVRSVRARVSELRHQLEQLDGNPTPALASPSATSPGAYPTIRELPLLGVTYADLLRRTKIQEAVYETLTQQYELAKVQEAKEIPSVKILDSASLPERKVFPPRLLIMAWSGVLGFAASAAIILGGARWRELDPLHPGKILAHEILNSLSDSVPWTPDARLHAPVFRLWRRWTERHHGSEILRRK
jgi:capsule polysaccharide export protein KpsE/RkpR